MGIDPKRNPAWKVLGVLALVVVTGVCSLGAWARHRAERNWDGFARHVESLLERINARDSLRNCPDLAPLPGNAWDDYSAAGKLIPPWGWPELNALGLFHQRDARADRASVLALLPSVAGVLDRLSLGARRIDARYPHPEARRIPNLGTSGFQLQASRFKTIGICRARLLGEEGRRSEALDLLMDIAVFGRDLIDRALETDVMDGQGVLSSVFQELKQQLISGDLQGADLLRLDRRLEALDAAWPDPEAALQSDLVYLGLLLLEEDRTGKAMHQYSDDKPRILRNWRSFYSSRLRSMQTFRQAEIDVDRAAQAQKLPFEEGLPILDGIAQRMRKDSDPLYSSFYNIDRGSLSLSLRARGRMMRMAARFLATGETLAMEDPMGGALRLSEENGVLRVWREAPGQNRPSTALDLRIPSSRR
jgi:hypothetical protein